MNKIEFIISTGELCISGVTMEKDGRNVWIYKEGILISSFMLRFSKLRYSFTSYELDVKQVFFNVVKNDNWRNE
jgi:hypothetical protein